MKAVGASLVGAGMLKLLNTPLRLDSDVAASPVLCNTHTHTHTHHSATHRLAEMNEGNEGMGKKLQTPFLCI